MTPTPYTTFRSFLRRCGCEQQFDAAFAEQSPTIGRFDETIADFLSIDESLVARCFDWRKTPEGREFYSVIPDPVRASL